MNSAAPTKIFGIRLGLDPKVIVVLLIGVAALLFWYNSRSDEETSAPATTARPARNAAPQAEVSAPGAFGRTPVHGSAASRRSLTNADHATTLRMRAIDATHGDIDPTLRLDLLVRLQAVEPAANSRNLFQMEAAPLTDALGRPIPHPIIPPKPLPPVIAPTQPPAEAEVNIPFKYYGFAKPVGKAEYNRGFFLDGDIILVAYEGEVLKQKYVVVELTPTSARIEDTELKKGKTLPLEPQARDEF